MTRKLSMVSAMAVAMALMAGPAMAKDIKIKWKMAGSLILDVEVLDPAAGARRTAGLLHFRAVGKPGTAEVRILSQLVFPPAGACLDGAGALFDFELNDAIATFDDLSQLYFVLDAGTACLNPATGVFDIEADFDIVGGRGKFEGATGDMHFSGFDEPVTGLMANAIVKATGKIHTPGDDDD